MSNGNDKTKETRINNLRTTQKQRQEDARNRVYQAIERLQKLNAKINFHTIAREAQVSVSYLYKYPDIKQQIAELRSKQNSLPVKPFAKANSSSQGKVISRLQDRIKKVEAENKELKRKCESLAGQVYRAHHLQAQIERLQAENERLKEKLGEQELGKKVTSIDKKRRAIAQKEETTTVQATTQSEDANKDLISMIQSLGVKVTKKLREEIDRREPEQVEQSIEAFQQYRATNDVKSQEACLLSMIRDEAQPNTQSEPKAENTKPEQKLVTASDKPNKKLINPNKLKQLSNLFNKDNG